MVRFRSQKRPNSSAFLNEYQLYHWTGNRGLINIRICQPGCDGPFASNKLEWHVDFSENGAAENIMFPLERQQRHEKERGNQKWMKMLEIVFLIGNQHISLFSNISTHFGPGCWTQSISKPPIIGSDWLLNWYLNYGPHWSSKVSTPVSNSPRSKDIMGHIST